jgi:hypothetical protein
LFGSPASTSSVGNFVDTDLSLSLSLNHQQPGSEGELLRWDQLDPFKQHKILHTLVTRSTLSIPVLKSVLPQTLTPQLVRSLSRDIEKDISLAMIELHIPRKELTPWMHFINAKDRPRVANIVAKALGGVHVNHAYQVLKRSNTSTETAEAILEAEGDNARVLQLLGNAKGLYNASRREEARKKRDRE